MTAVPKQRARVRGAVTPALGFAALAAVGLSACSDAPLAPDSGVDARVEEAVRTGVTGPIVPGHVIVQFAGPAMPADLEIRYADRILPMRGDLNLIEVAEGRELDAVAELRSHPGVTFAEPDWVRSVKVGPNDSYFGYKWGLHNDGTINSSTGEVLTATGAEDADIDWLEAYEFLAGRSFQNVRIAILDTGIQQDHVDLAAKIVMQYDFFDDDPDAADDHGHGSHTAGIAAAIGNNGTGVTGVAWHGEADLMVAKVCGQIFGGPNGYGCPSSATANAIYWAADNGASVMNLSLGGSSPSSAERTALQYALSRETLGFCATGNDNGSVSWPAAFPECVAVGATDWSDNRASYSNFGPETELAAPGGDNEDPNGYSYILSTYEGTSTSYAFSAGTSMATPMAAGLGGLLASLGVSTADGIRSLMQSTADDLGPNGRDDQFGYGRINAYTAVVAAVGGGGPTNSPPAASFTYSCTELTCSFDGTASSDPDGDALSYSWAFGDGGTATGATASHTYGAGGTYTATLTVSDGSASDSESQSVTVAEPPSGDIALSATGYKVRGRHTVDLSWSGATSAQVDIYRNGGIIETVANDGAYTDSTGSRGSATYTYQVCEAGTSTCSNQVTVVF